MNPPVTARRAARSRRPSGGRATRLLALAAGTLLLFGLVPVVAQAGASASLALAPDTSAWAKIGGKRMTSIAEVTTTVATMPVEVGVQFRATSKSAGYRAKLQVAEDGTVVGAFTRVRSSVETTVGTPASLGFSVAAGDRVHLEATVVAKKTVKLYLRAWKDGTAKPVAWQLAATDSSSKRSHASGYVYLWARTPLYSPEASLPYTVDGVAGFSAARAAAIGVGNGTQSAGTGEDDTFSIAVIGDTQGETTTWDPRFANRTEWLAANADDLDLRWVLHTGDMTNWGWLESSQYTVARKAMAKLADAGIPYSVTVGNHDTRAVGWDGVAGSTKYGGSAYASNPECPTRLSAAACKSWLLVRDTAEFNDSFPLSSMKNVGGTYETGKVDNMWATFTANDTSWLVLSLELWPRKGVVEWARKVVADHPDHNVIIETHSYLNSNGSVYTDNGGYGETTPKYLYDEVVSKYPNVKIVTSGHTGGYTSRTDETVGGNTVVSYLGNVLTNANNPIRVLTINTATGKVTSTVYSNEALSGATVKSTDTETITLTR